MAIDGGLDPQTITVDGGEITLPTPSHENEAIYYSFVKADATDMELVRAAGESTYLSLASAKNCVQVEGPFKLTNPNIPKFVRLGAGSTIRVTVLRDR